ncbi:MAG: sn-glycerol-3-phosphate ABC transporter ATP-binding protein UgpC [Ignavibacteriae bacterium]|nr:sn-glycerol-3-phosphate ABC transporter ATP-binding protein UgpC [Ignavibacteriota bacterium]
MASVRLTNVTKRFENSKAATIEGLHLEVQDGEFMVLVGPSGCGKSTTLRMVAGLEEATAGEIYIGDRLVNDVAPKDRDIAMVFQNYALYPHMTVRENLAFGLTLRKYPKADIAARVDETAALLEIGELLDRKPKALSGGQRQRVALGRAIVRKPNVFLFDEPLSNLDAKLRVQMRTEIKKLHLRLGTTMIYVTHDQVEAMTMGDRITVMKAGLIHQVDTPLNVYHRPADLFVAGFIGNPAMNVLSGALDAEAHVLSGAGFSITLPEAHAAMLRALAGRKIVLGIRPENVHFNEIPCELPAAIELVHEVSELLGNEVYAYLKAGTEAVTARAAAMPSLGLGEKTRAWLDLAKAHYFDAETEKRIG